MYRELLCGGKQTGSMFELALKRFAEMWSRQKRELAVTAGGYVGIRNECVLFNTKLSGNTRAGLASLCERCKAFVCCSLVFGLDRSVAI